jgi:hypothetical protein
VKKGKQPYPYLTGTLGCEVIENPIPHVKWKQLNAALRKNKIMKKFSDLFGCQTCLIDGPYPYDVEAVLVRIYEKRLTGTQLLMD